MFLQAGIPLFGAPPPPASNDIQDLFMCESYFDEYTTTGSTIDTTVSANLQQLQQQQLLHQFALHQQQQQQQQQLPIDIQGFLASNVFQQQLLQQQQQQLQAQHEQQQLMYNSQTQLAFRLALAQASANASFNVNANAVQANFAATSPSDSASFFSSPDLMASSLSPESDTLMLPNSPGAFSSISSGEDGAILSPLLLSTQSAGAAASLSPTKIKSEKSSKSTKRQSIEDGTDAESKADTPAATKRTKKTASFTKATPSAPKKPRAKKTSKNGSDQSDMEMSISSSASIASTTPSPQTLAMQLPTSLSAGASGITSASELQTSTAGFFQPLPMMPLTPTSGITTPTSPFGQPLWKMTPGMVLPPTIPLGAAGFDSSTFASSVIPGLDVSAAATTAATVAATSQQTPGASQSGQTLSGQSQSVQQKIPITRLKPPQALVTPPPAPPTTQVPQPTKQQKKVAHNAIERRYRNNINDRINDLKNVVPALCNIKTKDDKDDDDDDEPQDADGVTRATKLNKATILRKATEYIIVLQKRENSSKAENAILRQLLTSLPGGIDLLEQHQAELASVREEASPAPESSSEDSNSESNTPPPTSTSSSGASRVLMAVFMCTTFFSSPDGSSGVNRVIMDDGQGAGRAMSSSSRIIGHASTASSPLGGSGWGLLGVATWDAWAALRTFIFMGCLLALVWPSYSRRGPFAQSKFPIMPKSSSPAQVYTTLSGLVPKMIPSSYFRLFFALIMELWRCLWIRLGIYPDLTDMVRPDIWARVVESQMSGGAGSSVSRFMLLYTIVRTLDEYTNARRQPPARVSATAALAFYISLRKAAKPLATLVAQQFMESARYTAKIFGIGQDHWLESMLQVEVGSAAWDRSIIEIESVMYGRAEYPQTEAILYQTMAPSLIVAQTQSVSVLQDAYIDCMSSLNAPAHDNEPTHATGRAVKFDDVVRSTLPGTRHHWYALVGKLSELWLSKNEQSAQLGDRLVSQIMAMHPRHHLTARWNWDPESTAQQHAGEAESSFQYYDQVIVYSLLEYAYLRRGMAGPSVRCGEKAWALLNERRRTKAPLGPIHSAMMPSEIEEDDNDRALLNVAYFAMNLAGFVEIKARVGLWHSVEALTSLIKKNQGDMANNDESEDVSQSEILNHIRTTLVPLTVHLRRQLDDESTTMLAVMQMASNSTRNKSHRSTVDFDPALRFLIDIGRVTYGAWEDYSEGSDSGCGSGGEEECRQTSQYKASLAIKKSDAERAWELCQEILY
ncbi:hypothetical protein BGX27_008131 [Mortierella sp. AM989]|nr:hypothetical protein BGX27_008131 [Mortierella sp. AM989]